MKTRKTKEQEEQLEESIKPLEKNTEHSRRKREREQKRKEKKKKKKKRLKVKIYWNEKQENGTATFQR